MASYVIPHTSKHKTYKYEISRRVEHKVARWLRLRFATGGGPDVRFRDIHDHSIHTIVQDSTVHTNSLGSTPYSLQCTPRSTYCTE